MRPFLEKFRLLVWLILILVAGFLTSGTVGYKMAREAIHRTFATDLVPAASDLVYAEIRKGVPGFALASSRSVQNGGAGLSPDGFARLIESYQSRFGCRIYFVDSAGIITAGANAMQHLRDLPGLRQVASTILYSPDTPVQTSYRQEAEDVFVNSRFIPELGWFLVIEQGDRDRIRLVRQAFLLNLAVGALVTGLVLSAVLGTIKRYQQGLAKVAGIDSITGLINRPAYQFVFQQTLLETGRTGEPLSLILVEVDRFKRLTDSLGRKAGDLVLQNMAEVAKKSVRVSDPVVLWSGNQLIIQLRDCPLDQAMAVAERLRQGVAAHDFGLNDPHAVITASLGVARHEPEEAGSSFLDRTCKALSLARKKGGNRVEPEIFDVDI